jgi:hypothetical protein
MAMAQAVVSNQSVPVDRQIEKYSVTEKNHVVVRLAAQRGELARGDSGRLVLGDDVDIPDLADFTDSKGR